MLKTMLYFFQTLNFYTHEKETVAISPRSASAQVNARTFARDPAAATLPENFMARGYCVLRLHRQHFAPPHPHRLTHHQAWPGWLALGSLRFRRTISGALSMQAAFCLTSSLQQIKHFPAWLTLHCCHHYFCYHKTACYTPHCGRSDMPFCIFVFKQLLDQFIHLPSRALHTRADCIIITFGRLLRFGRIITHGSFRRGLLRCQLSCNYQASFRAPPGPGLDRHQTPLAAWLFAFIAGFIRWGGSPAALVCCFLA